MNRNIQDNALPTLNLIRKRFVSGDYSHDIENTIHSLLNTIDELESKLVFAERQLEHQLNRQHDH